MNLITLGWGFLAGAVLMWVVCFLQYISDPRRIKRIASIVCTRNETIECYNATVFVDRKGQVSWMDNDRNIKVRIKEKGKNDE